MSFLKRAFGWLTNRWVIAAIGLTLLSLLVWYLGEFIAFGGWAPLESDIARLIAILVIVVIWAAKTIYTVLREQKTEANVVDALGAAPAGGGDDQASAEEVAVLQDRFREALAVLKKAKLGGRGRRRRLYQLPWYLIIGPPGAGKTTALKNSGLKFPLTDRFGDDAIRGVGGTRNCDWWFTDEAVLLDTAGRYTTQDSDQAVDSASWGGFLQLLRRYRRRRPVDGVLVAISLTDIASGGADTRQHHAQAVRKRLQELQSQLKIKVPVYVVFTKCDLISGFIEFFDDLGRDERAQVWGTTFPIQVSEAPGGAIDAFGPQFDALIERLDERLLYRLDQERDPRRRGAILGFSQQMASLKPALQEFIAEAFHPSRFEEPILVRGAYFSSGTQEGTPIDRVLSAVSATFGLDRQAMPPFSGPGRSYFLTRLLRDVVFREADLVGDLSIWTRHRTWIERGSYAAAAVVLIALGAAWSVSFVSNQGYVVDVADKVAAYAAMPEVTSGNTGTLVEMLPALDALRALPGGYDEREASAPFAMGFGLYQGDKLGVAARAAYRRGLNQMMLPRLLERLEVQLRQNFERPDVLYEALKAYLMLRDPARLDPLFVEAWMTLDWDLRLPGASNAQIRDKLRAHLVAMLENALPQLLLDGDLVKNARDVLARRPLAERVYLQVKREAAIGGPEEWRLINHVRDAPRYFVRRSGAPLTKGVPGLFTYAGYKDSFLPKTPGMAKRATDESWVMGPDYAQALGQSDTSALTKSVLDLYYQEYIGQWQTYLNDLEIAPFRNFREAAEIAKGLSGPQSPIKVFLTELTKETQLVKTPIGGGLVQRGGDALRGLRDQLGRIIGPGAARAAATPEIVDPASRVDKHFEPLHKLVKAGDGAPPPIDQTLAAVNALYVHLGSMRDASTIPPGAAEAAGRLRLEADRLPVPVSRWLRTMARQSSFVTVSSARTRLNEVWAGDVAPYCRNALGNRYPIVRASAEDVNLDDFARYFGPQGLVDSFVTKNLKPYVDMSVHPWRQIDRGGARIGISPAALGQLESAMGIKEAFFAGGGQQPKIRFTLRPLSLHRAARQVLLELGDQRLVYRHGPQRVQGMQWPPPDGTTRARIVFSALGGEESTSLTAEGPWALFRLLDKGTRRSMGADRFRWTFTAKGLSAVFELKASSVANPFRPDALEGFRCLGKL